MVGVWWVSPLLLTALHLSLLPTTTAASAASAATPSLPDIDLMGAPSSWRVVVDGVMGGRSSATLTPSGTGSMTFSGTISLVGGGFASIKRYLPAPVDLRSYAGVVVAYDLRAPTAATGGQIPLALRLALHPALSQWGFGAAFAVPASSATDAAAGQTGGQAFMPIGAFVHAFNSRKCDTCVFDASRVSELDLWNLFEEGPFSVHLTAITAVAAPRPSSLWTDPGLSARLGKTGAIADEIGATITRGVSLYSKGYPDLCAAVYAETALALMKVVAETALDAVSRRAICGALSLNLSSDVDIAWALRRAFDAVLAVTKAIAAADAGGGGDAAAATAAAAAAATGAVRAQDDTNYPSAVQGSWMYDGGATAVNCSRTTGQPADWETAQMRNGSSVAVRLRPLMSTGATPRAEGGAATTLLVSVSAVVGAAAMGRGYYL